MSLCSINWFLGVYINCKSGIDDLPYEDLHKTEHIPTRELTHQTPTQKTPGERMGHLQFLTLVSTAIASTAIYARIAVENMIRVIARSCQNHTGASQR
jgi:hypothetical protein